MAADNVVDSLVVVLKLDPTQYTQAEKKFLGGLNVAKAEAARVAADIEKKGQQGATGFDLMAGSALKLGAILVGGLGLKDFITKSLQAGTSMGFMARNIGISAQQLGLWQNAIRMVGGDIASVGPSLLGLSQALTTISVQGPGSSNLIAAFQAIGVNVIDPVTGKLKTLAQLLPEIHKGLQGLTPQQQYFFGQKLGLSPDFINLLAQSDPLFKQYLANAEAAGTITAQQTQAAKDLTKAWGGLMSLLTRVGYEFAGEIDPALTTAINWITKLGEALDKVGDNYAASDLGAFIGGVAGFAVGGPIGAAIGVIGGGLIGAVAGGPGKPSPAAATAGGGSLFNTIQTLEGGQPNSRTATGVASDPYAYGRNQITLGTALRYDPSATAAKLLNPAYNDAMARRIEADYNQRYHGNMDAIAIAYHNGPGAADRYVASGGDTSSFGPQTMAYLRRERAMTGGSTSNTTNIGTINVNAPKATDAKGIASDLRAELSNNQLISQGNGGTQ